MDGNNTEKDIKLENHVKGVFDVVGTAVEMIDNLNQLSPVVVDLGTRHFHYGSRKEHLPVRVFQYENGQIKIKLNVLTQ